MICVCGGDGFPKGSATAVRIMLIGKALLAANFSFELMHCGPSPTNLNQSSSGWYEGIQFRYTTYVRRPANWLLRVLSYALAVANLTGRLFWMRATGGKPVIYLYVMQGILNLYMGTLCRVLGLPLVQEMCEWWPGERTCSRLTHFLYRSGIVFRNATGVLAISREIEQRIRRHAQEDGLQVEVQHLPAVMDMEKFRTSQREPEDDANLDVPRFVWCGTVDGWIRDVLFLVRTHAEVIRRGYHCRLVIVGLCSEANRARISAHAAACGLQCGDFELTGWVSDQELSRFYHSAAALLMPLWDDDRSLTRMPNKLPEYLCSGRPVITSPLGAVKEVLQDNQTACFVPPGEYQYFAGAMIRTLQETEWAAAVGMRGRDLALEQFDYRSYSRSLGSFFEFCSRPKLARTLLLPPQASAVFLTIRNLVCSVLALLMIATGAVRRARARAFTPGTVTAIYFHKPGATLFLQSVRWLKRHGYQFISAEQLVDYLRDGCPVPQGAVWLSFDDGAVELYRELYPILEEQKVPATLFIPSGIVEGDGLFPWVHPRKSQGNPQHGRHAVTVEELRIMARIPGVTIGSHTVTHSKLPWCDEQKLNQELGESKRTLESWLQRPVSVFSYPNGDFDARSAEYLAGHGYRIAVTTESAFVDRTTDFYQVPRFSVADDIYLPEAICNMVGLWRPYVEPVKQLARRMAGRGSAKLKTVIGAP